MIIGHSTSYYNESPAPITNYGSRSLKGALLDFKAKVFDHLMIRIHRLPPVVK